MMGTSYAHTSQTFFARGTLVRDACRWLAVALVAVALVLTAAPSLMSGAHGVNRFQDDAFYYLVGARNFIEYGTFSLDGLHATNGFHPLWMGLVVGVLLLLGSAATLEHQVLAVKTLELLALTAAVAVCMGTALRRDELSGRWRVGFAAMTLFLLCPWYVVFEQGMETTLLAALFIFVVRCVALDKRPALAIGLALLFLCRLDSAIFVGLPIGLWMAWRSKGPLRRRLLILLPLAICMLVVTGFYLVTTGHPVPISGAVRSSFPQIRWHGGYLIEPITVAQMYGWGTFWKSVNILLCAVVLTLSGTILLLDRHADEVADKLRLLVLVGLLLLLNLVLFQKWEKSVDPRYLALPTLIACLTCAAALQGLATRAAKVLPIASHAVMAGILVTMASITLARGLSFERDMAQREDFIRTLYKDISAALPKGAVVAGTDVGALAFWTQRRTVNLDGVMNDFAYQDVLRDRRLREYLSRAGVTHIATGLWNTPEFHTGRPPEPMYRHMLDPAAVASSTGYSCHDYYVYSYVHDRYSDALCLASESEVFRRKVGRYGQADVVYVVYRLPG